MEILLERSRPREAFDSGHLQTTNSTLPSSQIRTVKLLHFSRNRASVYECQFQDSGGAFNKITPLWSWYTIQRPVRPSRIILHFYDTPSTQLGQQLCATSPTGNRRNR